MKRVVAIWLIATGMVMMGSGAIIACIVTFPSPIVVILGAGVGLGLVLMIFGLILCD